MSSGISLTPMKYHLDESQNLFLHELDCDTNLYNTVN